MHLQDDKMLVEAATATESLLGLEPGSQIPVEDLTAMRALFPLAGRWRAFLEVSAKADASSAWGPKHQLNYEVPSRPSPTVLNRSNPPGSGSVPQAW